MWPVSTETFVPVFSSTQSCEHIQTGESVLQDMEPIDWFDNVPFVDSLRGFSTEMYGQFGKPVTGDYSMHGQQQQQQQQQQHQPQPQYAYQHAQQAPLVAQQVQQVQQMQSQHQQPLPQQGYIPQHYMPVMPHEVPHQSHHGMSQYQGYVQPQQQVVHQPIPPQIRSALNVPTVARLQSKQKQVPACINCQKSHLSCDRGFPCRRCIVTNKADSCYQAEHKKRGWKRGRKRTLSDDGLSPKTSASTPSSGNSVDAVEALKAFSKAREPAQQQVHHYHHLQQQQQRQQQQQLPHRQQGQNAAAYVVNVPHPQNATESHTHHSVVASPHGSFAPVDVLQFLYESTMAQVITTGGEFAYVSSSFAHAIGYEEADLIGKPVSDFLHPTDVATVLDEMASADLQNEERRFLYRAMPKSRTTDYISFEVCGRHMYDAQTGTARCFVATARQLSTASDRPLATPAAGAGGAMDLAYMAKYSLEGICTNVTPGVANVLGYQPAELIGKWGYNLVHPEDLTRINSVHDQICASLEPISFRYRLLHKAGNFVLVESLARAIPGAQSHVPESLLCTVRFISRIGDGADSNSHHDTAGDDSNSLGADTLSAHGQARTQPPVSIVSMEQLEALLLANTRPTLPAQPQLSHQSSR